MYNLPEENVLYIVKCIHQAEFFGKISWVSHLMHEKSMSSDFFHECASKQITWKISFRASKPQRLAGLYDTSLSESLIAAKTAEMHDATI